MLELNKDQSGSTAFWLKRSGRVLRLTSMFCTTQRICAIGTSWRKSDRKRANSFGSIVLSWTRRYQKLKTGTNGRSIVWTHERCWSCFWMNEPSIAHSRQVRLPKSKSLLVGKLPTYFWKRNFKNIFSWIPPPPIGGANTNYEKQNWNRKVS